MSFGAGSIDSALAYCRGGKDTAQTIANTSTSKGLTPHAHEFDSHRRLDPQMLGNEVAFAPAMGQQPRHAGATDRHY